MRPGLIHEIQGGMVSRLNAHPAEKRNKVNTVFAATVLLHTTTEQIKTREGNESDETATPGNVGWNRKGASKGASRDVEIRLMRVATSRPREFMA